MKEQDSGSARGGGGGGGGVVILLEIGLCYTNRDKLRPCDLIAWSAPLPFFFTVNSQLVN